MTDQKLLNKIGSKLKKLREKKNLTQEKLAQKVGLHRNYIGKIERGEQNPSIIILFKICAGLECELSEFIKSIF